MFKIAEQQKRFLSFKIRPLRSWRVCLEFKSVWYYPKVSPLLTTRQCDISKWQNVRLGVIGGWEYKHRKSRMLKNPGLQYMEAIEQTLKWGGRIGGLLAQSAKLTIVLLSPIASNYRQILMSVKHLNHLKWPLATSPPILYSISHWTFLTSMKRFSNCSLFFLHGKCRHIIRSQQGDPAAETGNASSFVR